MSFPIKIPAIRVEQRLGEFFVTSLPASLLLDICYTIEARILEQDNTDVIPSETMLGKALDKLTGTQRKRKESRIEEIRKYTETVDASFPNSIILGANYDTDGRLIDNEEKKWSVEKIQDNCYYLIIPTKEKLASIIDGQHRVFGFQNSNAKDTQLVCSIFLDLPIPYHAQIFTTINMNQKSVDRNLAYNLFQFEMDEGESISWSPETLAVYYARMLSQDKLSPLNGKLKLGLSDTESKTSISMASVIDGILSLITSNPKNDRIIMHSKSLEDGRSRLLLNNVQTKAPLRLLYLEQEDKTFYELILNYLKVVDQIFWKNNISIFNKTLGIQALFDVLKEITSINGSHFNYTEEYFYTLFLKSKVINFDSNFFDVQSKVRSRIKKSILLASNLKQFNELGITTEVNEYKKVLNTIS